jgi:hypothetical protein
VSDTCHWLAAVHWGQAGTWALAIGTFLLAFFTWLVSRAAIKTLEQNKALVDETRRLVEINNNLVENEEKHYKERLTPYVVFKIVGSPVISIEKISIRLEGKLRNYGMGMAINVEFYFVVDDSFGKCSIRLPAHHLASNEESSNIDFIFKAKPDASKNTIDRFVAAIKSGNWYIVSVSHSIDGDGVMVITKPHDGFPSCIMKIDKFTRDGRPADLNKFVGGVVL